MKKVIATQVVDYAAGAECDQYFRWGQSQFWFSLSPGNVADEVEFSAGTLTHREYQREQLRKEYIKFDGTDTARAKCPAYRIIGTPDVRGVVSPEELVGQPRGFSSNSLPHIRLDGKGGFKADYPFYGGALVRYWTSFDLYSIRFDPTADADVLEGGQLIARWGCNVALYDVPIFGKISSVGMPGTEEVDALISIPGFELMRVTSQYVVSGEEKWEKPPGFPDDTYFNAGTAGPKKNGAVVLERTHEVWYFDPLTQQVRMERANRSPLKPYVFYPTFEALRATFTPAYSLQINEPPVEISKYLLGYDQGGIINNIRRRYPGIE